MKRLFDVVNSTLLLICSTPIFVGCILLVKLTSKGPVLHVSKRVGAHNILFRMYKFRTMKIDTPQLATHLMKGAKSYLTPIGGFLRKTSLDELPQLLNVLKGEMSLVGPRPALFNQDDQIALRTQAGCHVLKPGITGWAQVNGRDDISIEKKVELDTWYFHNRSFFLDCRIIVMTFLNVILRKNVSH